MSCCHVGVWAQCCQMFWSLNSLIAQNFIISAWAIYWYPKLKMSNGHYHRFTTISFLSLFFTYTHTLSLSHTQRHRHQYKSGALCMYMHFILSSCPVHSLPPGRHSRSHQPVSISPLLSWSFLSCSFTFLILTGTLALGTQDFSRRLV